MRRRVPIPGLDGGGGGIQDQDGGTPRQETDQQSEHLLRGGRYASCVYAGGLSFSQCKGNPYFRWREVKEDEEENVIAPVEQDKSEVAAVDTPPSDHAVETGQTE